MKVKIPILEETNDWSNDNLWQGDKVFFIHATDIENALFLDEAGGGVRSLTVTGVL